MAAGPGKGSSLEDRLQALTQVDAVMDRMVAAIAKVKTSQDSTVRLPKAELDLLGQIELARDFMTKSLQNQNDRTLLRDILGGDCSRIARIRAICESIEFSEMNRSDQRLRTCLQACQSVEKVLIDLGDGDALRKAQARIASAIQEGTGLDVLSAALTPEDVPEEGTPRERRKRTESSGGSAVADDRSADRLLALVRADAARMESQLRGDLSSCQEKLQQELAGCDSRLQKDIAGFQSNMQGLVDKWEERLTVFQKQLDVLPGEERVCQGEEKLQQLLEESRTGLENRIGKNANEVAMSLKNAFKEMEKRIAVDAEIANVGFKVELEETQKSCKSIEMRVDALEKGHTAFEARFSSVEVHFCELVEKLEATQQMNSALAGKVEKNLVAATSSLKAELLKNSASELEALASHCQHLEKMVNTLRHDIDIDAVWNSFALVGDKIRKVEQNLEKAGCESQEITTPRTTPRSIDTPRSRPLI